MEIKPILSEQDYSDALQVIEDLFDAQPGTPDSDRLEVLVTLVEAYETRHYAIPLPDPIAAIEYHLQRLGLTRKDLEPLIGSRGRVSEVLNRRRPLTVRMIRNLSAGLGISAEALIQEYPLVDRGSHAKPQQKQYAVRRTEASAARQVADRESTPEGTTGIFGKPLKKS
jgi:HTH-type transcriptional regulator/antitoxin HigA